MIETIRMIQNNVTFEELQNVFCEWIQPVTWISEHRKEYYIK
jgi:hypothetical protein